jgi:hypothetical protein
MFRSVDWALLDHTAAEPVTVGDLVSVDAGGMPIYRVVQLGGPSVRVACERGDERDLPLSLFRWRGAAAHVLAA